MPKGVYDHGDPVARFWLKVNRDGPTQTHMATCCWVWTASARGGYGRLKWEGRHRGAHGVAWMLMNGTVPDGFCVLHRCDNPRCVRADPDPIKSHLFVGTNVENVADRDAKGRQASGDRHGSRTRPDSLARGERNGKYTKPEATLRGDMHGRARLTEAAVREIRTANNAGESQLSIARRMGIGETTIRHIIARRTWTHVP